MMDPQTILHNSEQETEWKWSRNAAAPAMEFFYAETKGEQTSTAAALRAQAAAPHEHNSALRNGLYNNFLCDTLGAESRANPAAHRFSSSQERMLSCAYKNRMFVQHDYQDHAGFHPQHPNTNAPATDRCDSSYFSAADSSQSTYFVNNGRFVNGSEFSADLTRKHTQQQMIMSTLNQQEVVQNGALQLPSYENQSPMIILDPPTRILFPERVYNMLNDASNDDNLKAILSWQPHGRCFVVRKPKEFVSIVLPRYFRGQHKMTSFQRQLNIYGFKRISQGRDYGAYYHELFLRGRPYLCRFITRKQVKGNRVKPIPNPGMEPDFYKMKPCLETDEEDSEADGAISKAVRSVSDSFHSSGLMSTSPNEAQNYRGIQTRPTGSSPPTNRATLHGPKEWFIPHSSVPQQQFAGEEPEVLSSESCSESMAMRLMFRDLRSMAHHMDNPQFPIVSQERRCREFDSMRRPLHMFTSTTGMGNCASREEKFSFLCNLSAADVSMHDVSDIGPQRSPNSVTAVLNESRLFPFVHQTNDRNVMGQDMGDLEDEDKDPLLDGDIASVNTNSSLEVDEELVQQY